MAGTLFAYFKRINDPKDKPDGEKVNSKGVDPSPPKNPKTVDKNKKSVTPASGSRSAKKKTPIPSNSKAKKRCRIVYSDEDDDENVAETKRNKTKKKDPKDDDWQPMESSDVSEMSEGEATDSDNYEVSEQSEEEAKPEKKGKTARATKTAAKTARAPKKPSASIKQDKELILAVAPNIQSRTWAHMKYDFLKPEKIRDAEKRRPDHPNYDSHTLFVPPDFVSKLTPAMKQWWEIKSQNFDCVIFMKLGKFYELYHMDASIGVNELGLTYMKHPEVAHSGFPEAGYARYAKVLVEKGYKAARVEQTETPEMMQTRCKQMRAPSKFDKVVKREVCQITSKGTRLYLPIEGEASSSDSAYLLAITEKKAEFGGVDSFGICFVDTSVGAFCLGQFDDDRHKSELRKMLAHYPPDHILLNKKTSKDTQSIVTSMVSSALVDYLANDTQFLSGSKALKMLHEKKYFVDSTNDKVCLDEKQDEWSEVLLDATVGRDMKTPKAECELAISALGACLWYLDRCKLDFQVLSTKNFMWYTTSNAQETPMKVTDSQFTMILDAATLEHLEVFCNSDNNGTKGTLLAKLDTCSTPFGKRMLRSWLRSPLCSVEQIKQRQEAVSALMKVPSDCEDARKMLKELPDMERLLLKIAVYGNAATADHPDSRAIYYEDYSQKKMDNLITLFKTLVSVPKIFKIFQDTDSKLLNNITNPKRENVKKQGLPDFVPLLKVLAEEYDFKEAIKTGKLTMKTDEKMEAIDYEMRLVDSKFDDHHQDLKKIFGLNNLRYVGHDRKRYQIEVPNHVANKAPTSFELTASKKGYKWYYTPEAKALLVRLQSVEEKKRRHLIDLNRRAFYLFHTGYATWSRVVNCLSVLDVLLALAKYGSDQNTCMPLIKYPSADQAPFVNIVSGRLPNTSVVDFIPNDTVIGVNEILLLLSGPNMGGKSTLMRQLGLIVIMAQIGCPVPAESCSLTPADRIFTRVGARDNILAGQSTFYVEMSETAAILKHASQRSIVLIDELGRGTTTFDGAAIAYAVLEHLINKGCMTVFSTHYHFLVEKFEKCPQVALVHMACMEEGNTDDTDDAKVENVTFLYKLTPGSCPSSHGFNAARLAGLEPEVVTNAKKQALKLQNHPKKIDLFLKFMHLSLNETSKLKFLLKEARKFNC